MRDLKRNDAEVILRLTFNKTPVKTENHQNVENTDVMGLVELHTNKWREEETVYSPISYIEC